MKDDVRDESAPEATLKPFTVSAVYDDGLESLVVHCMAAGGASRARPSHHEGGRRGHHRVRVRRALV